MGEIGEACERRVGGMVNTYLYAATAAGITNTAVLVSLPPKPPPVNTQKYIHT